MTPEPASRRLVLLDAPSNLGLRPPKQGSVPGCYKLGWALREAGLADGLPVEEAGVVVPPRYEAAWEPGEGDRNGKAIGVFSTQLADRLVPLLKEETFVVVLGGDCSVLVGVALAAARMGRFGIAFLDGHSDFRHPGNAAAVCSAAGEDLAIITGRGDERLTNLENRGPYIRETDVAALGMREEDEYTSEMEGLGISVWSVSRIRDVGIARLAEAVTAQVAEGDTEGFWTHLDLDILDPEVMPAVDTPSPGGLTYDELAELLTALSSHPKAVGMDLCILDPDLDPDGEYGKGVVSAVRPALESIVGHAEKTRR